MDLFQDGSDQAPDGSLCQFLACRLAELSKMEIKKKKVKRRLMRFDLFDVNQWTIVYP